MVPHATGAGVGYVDRRSGIDSGALPALDGAVLQMNALRFDTDENYALSMVKLKSLAIETDDPDFVLRATLFRAERGLARAMNGSNGFDPTYVEDAADAYQEILSRFADQPLAVGAALSGLAAVEENRFVVDRDPSHRDRARRYLERIRDDERMSTTPFMAVALARLNNLDATFTEVRIAPPLPRPEPLVGPPAPEDSPSGPPPAEASDTTGTDATGVTVDSSTGAEPAKADPTSEPDAATGDDEQPSAAGEASGSAAEPSADAPGDSQPGPDGDDGSS